MSNISETQGNRLCSHRALDHAACDLSLTLHHTAAPTRVLDRACKAASPLLPPLSATLHASRQPKPAPVLQELIVEARQPADPPRQPQCRPATRR